MANKYVTDLPLINSLNSGDYIHVDQNNTSCSTKLSSVLAYVNAEIQSNPTSLVINNNSITNNAITSEKITNNAITSEKITNNAITSEKITNNAITVDKLNPNVVNSSKGIMLDNGIAVKLDAGGGLMFNNSGELKIAPAAATSSVVVIRPSDAGTPQYAGATDDYHTVRTAVNGELRPCFKTVTGAARWIRGNIVGNCTVFLDEDTNEGEAIHAGLIGSNEDKIKVVYYDQAQVNTIFGNNSGMKAGLYVWPILAGQKMEGGIWYSDQLGNENITNYMYLRSRYLRGSNYSDARYFDEPPKAINYNVYFTNNINLNWNASNDDDKWGTSATRVSNWSNRINQNSTTTHGFLYIRNAGLIIVRSRMYIRDINFVCRHNCNDITTSDMQNCRIEMGGVTLSLLGTGFYNYGVFRSVFTADILVGNLGNLYSSQTNTPIYPSYGLAIVGNKYTAGSNLSAATMIGHFISLERGPKVRFVDYDPFTPNQSKIRSSIILDGDFVFQYNNTISLYGGSSLEMYSPACIVNNVNIRNQRVDDSQPNRISTTANWSLYPITFSKGDTLNVYFQPIRKWTLDGSITEVDRYDQPPILSYKGAQESGLGTFTGSPTTTWNYTTTTDQYKASNIEGGNISYRTVTTMPQVSTFFRFTENGSVSSVNYGAGVRD